MGRAVGGAEPSSFGELLRGHRLAARLTQEQLAERAGLSARGIQDLERGVRRAPHADTTRRIAEGLGLGDAERTAMQAAVDRAGLSGGSAAATPRICALPMPLSTFVGRQAELAEILCLLGGTRLLTLAGAGGMGKTRLALEAARLLADDYADGAELVELAALANPEFVTASVATVLGIAEQSGRVRMDVVTNALRTRELLLILDNCEHVIDACAELAQHLLQACPRLRILTTSREPLGIPGERIWRVPSLSLPVGGEDLSLDHVAQSEAVRLFTERAASVLPSFKLTECNSHAVAQICLRLDGIPLSLELAAARITVLSIGQFADRLDDPLRLLTAGSRTAPPRQQTLRATLDWSYRLLTDQERRLLDRLSVFAGSWTLEAAEAVCAGEGIQHAQVVELLARLVDKSLVVVDRSPDEHVRYRLLEPIRQCAAELFARDAAADVIRRAHAAFFLMLAERIEPELYGPEQRTWFDQLERDFDNLRAALDWTSEQPERVEHGLRLASALFVFWDNRGHLIEGCHRLMALLARSGPSASNRARAKALFACGHLLYLQAETEAAARLLNESVGLWRELGDKAGLGWALFALALNARYRDPAMARAAAMESLTRFRQLGGVRPGLPQVLWLLGSLARAQGNYAHAYTLFEEFLAAARAVADPWAVAMALRSLGGVRYLRGELTQAVMMLKDALVAFRDLGSRRMVADCLEGIAVAFAATGRAERALRLAGAAATLREYGGAPLSVRQHAALERRLRPAWQQQSTAAAESAWQTGRSLSAQQAVREALAEEPAGVGRSNTRQHLRGLTAREREVVALIAQGLSNRGIAQSLAITHGTAHRHVANILGKLGLHSRAQIAVWAVEHRLGVHG